MNALGLLARLVTAGIGLSVLGAVATLAIGLLSTQYLVASLVVLLLVVLVVGGLAGLGVGGAQNSDTTYW